MIRYIALGFFYGLLSWAVLFTFANAMLAVGHALTAALFQGVIK